MGPVLNNLLEADVGIRHTHLQRQKPQRTKMRGEDYQLGDKGMLYLQLHNLHIHWLYGSFQTWIYWFIFIITNLGGSNPCKTPNFGSGGPCGASTMSAFGTSSMPGFGSSSRPPFEASSTLAFGFCSTPLFGQPTSTFDVNAVGANPFPYGTQSSHFGEYFLHFFNL